MLATGSTSRTSLVDPANGAVSVSRQLELLHIPRSSYYYKPKGRKRAIEGEDRERAMRLIDEIHLEMPYAGARKIASEVARRTGGAIAPSRRATAGMMEEMNVRPVYPKPNLSRPSKRAAKHPYLLKNKAIRFPNQVWSVDITYVAVGRTHMYLTCVIDWYSRYIVGWRLAADMGAAGVCECVRAAMERHGEPAIINSDQGSVFNSREYEALLAAHGVRQSMDGKARWVDNVIIERWFRSLKTEKLRLGEYSTPAELRREIADYVEQYNDVRPHQSLGNDRPSEWYHSGLMAA